MMYRIVPEVQQDWSIIKIVNETCPPSWRDVFMKNIDTLQDISNKLDNIEFYPRKELLFNAFNITPMHRVRVVILGQDPYHDDVNGVPRAMGLAFSSPHNMNIPPSLRNIFKEIKRTYPDFIIPTHGDLTNWARQGVLLLNTSLTVLPNKPNSHKDLWKPFIINVLRELSNYNCIYLLWGNEAQKYREYITGTVLTAGHPSPLNRKNDFIGCNHFLYVNKILKEPIDWSI